MSVTATARRFLPDRVLRYLELERRYRAASAEYRSLLRHEVGPRFRVVDEGPTSPEEVISRTALMKSEDLAVKSDR